MRKAAMERTSRSKLSKVLWGGLIGAGACGIFREP